jgi:hypothetical protein
MISQVSLNSINNKKTLIKRRNKMIIKYIYTALLDIDI